MGAITIRVCDFCQKALKTDDYYKVIVEDQKNAIYTPYLHDAVSFDVCRNCYSKIMGIKKNDIG